LAVASNVLKVWLSSLILDTTPEVRKELSVRLMAFNVLYGGEPDERERARVMSTIRRLLSKHSAKIVLRNVDSPMKRIVQLRRETCGWTSRIHVCMAIAW
jgi:hypothetical protein